MIMDITSYRNTNGLSLIEVDGLSAPIAWLNESVAQHKTKEEMLAWCENYYATLKLTDEERESIIERSYANNKNVPKDFLIQLRISCEILYFLIKEDIDHENKKRT
jgi:Zn-dependent M32 family carboxypeptidase